MNSFKRLMALSLILAAMAVFASCGNSTRPSGSDASAPDPNASSETYTLKFSHEMAEGTPEAAAAEKFAANVNEKTNGAVTIKVYPHNLLGDPATAIESAALGNIDIVCCASGNFSRFNSIFNIDTIPYLYKDGDAFIKILNESGALDQQKQILLDNGFIMLNEARNCFRGPYRVLCSTKPIQSIEDLKGLRLRAFENTNYMTAYELLGANPIVLPWADVFTSLQQGVIEAAACAIGSLKSEGFTQVASYVANVNEYQSSILIVGTNNTFSKLPEEYISVIKECADQFGKDVSAATDADLDTQIAEMEAGGAVFVDIDTAPAREILKDFYYSLEKNGTIPEGTVDIALAG